MDAAPRAPLRFSKMHGAGNDFVVIDLRDGTAPPDAALCRALANRHTGVGCDQILTIQAPRSAGAVAAYGIWNADGSASQQCGNGARCVAAWIHRDGARRDGVRRDRAGHASDGSTFDNLALDRFALDSPAGTHAVRMLGPRRFLIAMGVPEWAPARIPMTGADGERDAYPVTVDGATLRIGAVSMGNPHAVVEVDDVGTAPVAALGAALQAHSAFPESVNVGFAQVLDRGRIRLRVFERGVGETLACGSGACAAAAVLMRRGRVDRDVDVELPGGTLRIAWPRDGDPITMAGPAAFVFEGEWWQ